jgi:hypothetical protein
VKTHLGRQLEVDKLHDVGGDIGGARVFDEGVGRRARGVEAQRRQLGELERVRRVERRHVELGHQHVAGLLEVVGHVVEVVGRLPRVLGQRQQHVERAADDLLERRRVELHHAVVVACHCRAHQTRHNDRERKKNHL